VVKLVKNGHREEDVLWGYSIEKAQRYYDSIIEVELEETLRDAMMVYHATLAAVPVDTEKYAKKRADAWKKYIDSLDIEKLKKKEKDRRNPLKQLKGLVPINFRG
jgi:hypothetical protein